jgi:hypothetical protein
VFLNRITEVPFIRQILFSWTERPNADTGLHISHPLRSLMRCRCTKEITAVAIIMPSEKDAPESNTVLHYLPAGLRRKHDGTFPFYRIPPYK